MLRGNERGRQGQCKKKRVTMTMRRRMAVMAGMMVRLEMMMTWLLVLVPQ